MCLTLKTEQNMAKIESWYEVYNPETGKWDKFRDPLNPDRFPEAENNQQKGVESEENPEKKNQPN